MNLCPCQSGKAFNNCCQPIINGTKKAETAEQLMRSRYSAFTTANINYLLSSHHSSSRPTKEKNDILAWSKSVQWMGLQILSKKDGATNQTKGWVEFKAIFIENGTLQHIHENSFFVNENNTWYYKSGEHK